MRKHIAKDVIVSLGFVLCVMCFSAEGAENELWLEAESFDTLGGWVIDQQSMGQMGSAYVMAHGMGIPVHDAETACTIPEAAHGPFGHALVIGPRRGSVASRPASLRS